MTDLKQLAQIVIWSALGLTVLALIAFVIEMMADAPALVQGFIVFAVVFVVSRLMSR